ncbi:MAG: hypothetical protein CMJ76_08115 [Planctomycetaceae bacterium]|nr:hypothetical protein [Planctomycetaceae bacterium]|tara:strand:- start:726 stop:1673 length:948 start_codon:yes stop_codon:yes gene_type:complete
MNIEFDCIVAGISCVDLLIGPLNFDQPLNQEGTWALDTITPTVGGNVSNSSIALARLGSRTAALSLAGTDEWGQLLISRLQNEGVDTSRFQQRDDLETSATAVLMNNKLEHIFAYKPGASDAIDRTLIDKNLDFIAKSKYLLLGYYALLPNLEPELHEVLKAVQDTGCKTALDCAGGGGGITPLDKCLPYLDIYIPTDHEAESQTGLRIPADMISKFRNCGATGVVGIKRGEDGILLSPADGQFLTIPSVTPPRAVVNTTGAGDSFYAGLISGLCREMDIESAAKLGAAAASWCITGLGATEQLQDFQTTIGLLN